MAKPVVIVVGADKGGVGKTTVSRTLLDYFSANNVPTRAFDTESPRGTLKRFHPDVTEIVDMTTTSDQMKIFDTLNAGTSVTVIDVRAGLLSPSLASLRDIGFLDAAKAGQITFAVFHILGPSIASLDEIAETANFMQGAKYYLVKNFINDTQFFQWDQATYNSYFHRIKDATELTTTYALGELTPEHAHERFLQYDHRWGEALPGTHAFKGSTDEQLLRAIDRVRGEFSAPGDFEKRFGHKRDPGERAGPSR
jgi:hypothetical protein